MKRMRLGCFQVESGRIAVCDPCYEKESAGIINNALQGTWIAETFLSNTGHWVMRNAYLLAYHEDHPPLLSNIAGTVSGWRKRPFEVSVDSGQAGIYDELQFLGRGVDEENEDWYQTNCELTLETDASAGVLNGGCVSSSGFGDGGYICRANKCDGKVTGIVIDFFVEEYFERFCNI